MFTIYDYNNRTVTFKMVAGGTAAIVLRANPGNQEYYIAASTGAAHGFEQFTISYDAPAEELSIAVRYVRDNAMHMLGMAARAYAATESDSYRARLLDMLVAIGCVTELSEELELELDHEIYRSEFDNLTALQVVDYYVAEW